MPAGLRLRPFDGESKLESAMTKKQLQETLREMGIDFPAQASREDLALLLDQANQRLWLKAAHNHSTGKLGQVIRRRGRKPRQPAEKSGTPGSQIARVEPHRPLIRLKRVETPRPARKVSAEDQKPEGEAQEKAQIFDRTRGLEAYALQRAAGECDLCGQKPGRLRPFYLTDPSQPKPPTIKTVAALCPSCHERAGSGLSLTDLKTLKRKARQSRIKEIAVTKKPPSGRKRPPPAGIKPPTKRDR